MHTHRYLFLIKKTGANCVVWRCCKKKSRRNGMEACSILRVLSPDSVVLMLSNTGAIVNAKLQMPMTAGYYQSAQKISPEKPIEGSVQLGEYDMLKYVFTGSKCDFSFSEHREDMTTVYKRVGVNF